MVAVAVGRIGAWAARVAVASPVAVAVGTLSEGTAVAVLRCAVGDGGTVVAVALGGITTGEVAVGRGSVTTAVLWCAGGVDVGCVVAVACGVTVGWGVEVGCGVAVAV